MKVFLPQRHLCMALCMAFMLVFAAPAAAQERDSSMIPVLFAETEEGITFYGVDEVNTLNVMGQLPDNITIGQPEGSDPQNLWLFNWWNMNVVLAPDGSQIALTADHYGYGEDAITFNLFLYDVASGSLRLAHNESWSGYPRANLRWSPDSRYVLINPVYGESGVGVPPYPQIFAYETASGQISKLGDLYYTGLIWASDSRSLLRVKGNDTLVAVNPQDSSEQIIGQVDVSLVNRAAEWVAPLCDFVWSPQHQRWYFIATCGTGIDRGEQVYSMDLSGDTRLEADFLTPLIQELGLSEEAARSAIRDLDIHNLYEHSGDFYAALEIFVGFDSNDYIHEWRLVKILAPDQVETRFQYPVSYISYPFVFPSPTNQFVAFLGERDAGVVVGNLETGAVMQEISRPELDHQDIYWRYWVGRWIDNHRFLYEDMTDVWLFDAATQQLVNLTADIEQTAWLLPQTNSN